MQTRPNPYLVMDQEKALRAFVEGTAATVPAWWLETDEDAACRHVAAQLGVTLDPKIPATVDLLWDRVNRSGTRSVEPPPSRRRAAPERVERVREDPAWGHKDSEAPAQETPRQAQSQSLTSRAGSLRGSTTTPQPPQTGSRRTTPPGRIPRAPRDDRE